MSDDRVYDRQLTGSFIQNALTNLISLNFHYEVDLLERGYEGTKTLRILRT